jgi:hypothetical protein
MKICVRCTCKRLFTFYLIALVTPRCLLHQVPTAKFLYVCATDAWTLNPNWLFSSVQAGVLLPPEK